MITITTAIPPKIPASNDPTLTLEESKIWTKTSHHEKQTKST